MFSVWPYLKLCSGPSVSLFDKLGPLFIAILLSSISQLVAIAVAPLTVPLPTFSLSSFLTTVVLALDFCGLMVLLRIQ